jgi:CheY-like chemotaxis protein
MGPLQIDSDGSHFFSRRQFMHQVLIVSSDIQRLTDFAEVFRVSGLEVVWEESAADALQRIRQGRPSLVIWDEYLEDMTALEAIQRLLGVDATINSAVISRLDPEKFHSQSEGLGVMAHIPFHPTKMSALEVIEALKRIAGCGIPDGFQPQDSLPNG